MGQPRSNEAFPQVRELWEAVVSSPNGIRVKVASRGEGLRLRFLFYHVRNQARKEAQRIYPQDHPGYGKSSYDRYSILVEGDSPAWVKIFIPSIAEFEVENL